MGTDGIAGLSGATTRLGQGSTLWTEAHAHCGPQLQGCNRAAAQASSSSGALRTPVNRHRSTDGDAGVADGLVRIRLGMSTRPKVGGVCTRTCAPVRVGASVYAGAWGYMRARGCAWVVRCGDLRACDLVHQMAVDIDQASACMRSAMLSISRCYLYRVQPHVPNEMPARACRHRDAPPRGRPKSCRTWYAAHHART